MFVLKKIKGIFFAFKTKYVSENTDRTKYVFENIDRYNYGELKSLRNKSPKQWTEKNKLFFKEEDFVLIVKPYTFQKVHNITRSFLEKKKKKKKSHVKWQKLIKQLQNTHKINPQKGADEKQILPWYL